MKGLADRLNEKSGQLTELQSRDPKTLSADEKKQLGTLTNERDDLNFKLQQASQDFGDMSKLLANVSQLFHDARSASLDKIGR
jgi:hypothetical protein